MPNVLERLATVAGEVYQRVNRSSYWNAAPTFANPGSATPLGLANAPSDYDVRDMMLDGSIYNPTTARSGVTPGGGGLKWVLRALNRPCNSQDESKWAIPGYYNPVPQIVGFYANTLYGHWGEELRPVIPTGRNKGNAVKANLDDALSRLWRWSRLDSRKDELTALAANQGTVGIRVVADVPAGGTEPRIYLDFDDPRFITRVAQDGRGNVIEVVLEYSIQTYDAEGKPADLLQVREIIGKDRFSYSVDDEEQLPAARRDNPLGVCPYVLLRHSRRNGDVFGRHAYAGSERSIWGIDLGLSQLDESLIAHVWPYLFATAPANKPAKFKTDKFTLIYSKTEAGLPQPTLETMVPDLKFADTLEFFKQTDAFVRERNPAMILSSLKLLSGISGETLQQVLKPAEAEGRRARAEYETPLNAALQIGLSLGVLNRVWDLGTGMGTKEAADRAYDDGQGPEAFSLADRPAIPPTVAQMQEQAKADEAQKQAKLATAGLAMRLGVPQSETFALAGYDEKRVAEMMAENAELGVVPTEAP